MPKKIIEAALFMSSRPLNVKELASIIGTSSLGYVQELLEELQKEYSERGIEIQKTGEGWSMQVKSDILPKVAHLTPYADLSGGHKRTLALVAYKEPIKQSEIVKLQGNKAYSYIKFLERRGLIKTERQDRTKLVYLTKEFERYFGEEKDKIREKLIKSLEKKEMESIDDMEKFEEELMKEMKQEPKERERNEETDDVSDL